MWNSPAVPRGTVSPMEGSTILTSTGGRTRPTVSTQRSNESSARVWKLTGEVSVMPQQIATSLMCILSITLRMTSMGHGEPAITPLRSEDRS